MREDDRERFWLRYLGSIRRTFCVLDPNAYEVLERKLSGASEATRSALGRVVRTRSTPIDASSAFCLFFDDFVMVEFSVVGNAGYLYDRRAFEREFLPTIQDGCLTSPASLKNKQAAAFRLIHRRDWQVEMDMQLLSRNVRSDPRPRRGGS
jgi:hypothetical protein